jgi:MFS transporter, OFA family, oxalate/formate antiporter
MLYTAKGTASALVPVASVAATTYGWSAVFSAAIVFNVIAALLAVIALKPLRARFLRLSASHAVPAAAPLAVTAAGTLEPIVMQSPRTPR